MHYFASYLKLWIPSFDHFDSSSVNSRVNLEVLLDDRFPDWEAFDRALLRAIDPSRPRLTREIFGESGHWFSFSLVATQFDNERVFSNDRTPGQCRLHCCLVPEITARVSVFPSISLQKARKTTGAHLHSLGKSFPTCKRESRESKRLLTRGRKDRGVRVGDGPCMAGPRGCTARIRGWNELKVARDAMSVNIPRDVHNTYLHREMHASRASSRENIH